MKLFVKFICLALVMGLCLPSTVFAEQEDVGTYSYYFSSYGVWVTNTSERTIEVAFDVIGRYCMDEIGASSIEVQRSANGTSGWVTTKTFTPDVYPQMMDSNSGAHGAGMYYTGTSGYYYRAYATFYASRNGGAGYVSSYSSVIKLS